MNVASQPWKQRFEQAGEIFQVGATRPKSSETLMPTSSVEDPPSSQSSISETKLSLSARANAKLHEVPGPAPPPVALPEAVGNWTVLVNRSSCLP